MTGGKQKREQSFLNLMLNFIMAHFIELDKADSERCFVDVDKDMLTDTYIRISAIAF